MGSPKTESFYRRVLSILARGQAPFLVGGGYALREHTGIVRQSKDLDIFVKPEDVGDVLQQLTAAGFATETTHPHWLAKVHEGEDFIDIIFSSGNGLSPVDDAFFLHAKPAVMFDVAVRLCPPEEMIWSKAFVMERERYDGADIAHLIHECHAHMDFRRLIARFGEHFSVLLSHLILFGFIYPDEKARIPAWVMRELLDRTQRELNEREGHGRVCHGPLLSRSQYQVDVHEWGYEDARRMLGAMTEQEIAAWTAAGQEHGADSARPEQ